MAASLGALLGTFVLIVVGAYTLIGPEPAGDAAGAVRDELFQGSGKVSAARQVELRQFVEQTCPACHGAHMAGSVGPPLSRSGLEHLTVNAVAMTLLQGRPEKGMPPWNGLLSKAEALWIAGFLKSGGVEGRHQGDGS